jgi:hypothetical protein
MKYNHLFTIILFICCIRFVTSASLAQEGFAALGAGGIELQKTNALVLLEKDLNISLLKITAKYVFENVTNEPYTTKISFPFPEYFPFSQESSDSGFHGGEGLSLGLSFSVKVNGKTISLNRERAAFIGKREVTELLLKYGLDITDQDKSTAAFNKLLQNQKDDLIKVGLDEYGRGWGIHEKSYWEQTFKGKEKTIIEFEYVPAFGNGMKYDGPFSDKLKSDFCIDSATLKALEKPINRSYEFFYLHYLISTTNSWNGPIRDFKLSIEKHPYAIISLCFDGIKKTAPNRFGAHLKNFTSDKEIKILFVGGGFPEKKTYEAPTTNSKDPKERMGMTWGIEKFPNQLQESYVHVGCSGEANIKGKHLSECNPRRGDMLCVNELPLLCIKKNKTIQIPKARQIMHESLITKTEWEFIDEGFWAEAEVRILDKIKGTDLTSPKKADELCSSAFGKEWRMAEFHDAPKGWNFFAKGIISSSDRFWVKIKNQDANCWK